MLFIELQQHFEIDDSKLLILARTCEKNEAVGAGKNGHTTTGYRDSPLGPHVGKQLFGELMIKS